jgi:glutaredoxin
MFDRTLLSQSIPKQCIDLTKLDHWEVVNKIQRVHENRALGKNNASRTRIPVVFLDHFGVPVYRQNV